jgi:hypothetical protein
MASPAAASHLIEIADPPVPNRSTPVREMTAAEKLKLTLFLAGFGLVLCAGSWWMLHNGYLFWGIIFGAVGLLCVVGAFGTKNLKGACPYCGNDIGAIPRKDRGHGTEVHCDRCHEYSVVNSGMVRPLDPGTTSETPKFESPVFKNSVWPKACVACGEPPVRLDDLSKTTVGAAHVLMGRLAIVRGSVNGIPYCDKHRDQLSLKIGMDKKLILCWTSLRMMRRYLAANRSRQAH